MSKLEKLLESIDCDKATPVSDMDIQRHEKDLHLKFGPIYTHFLSKYGCVVAGSKEIYGVCGDNASIPSAIHATKSARRQSHFPQHLLVIAEDGSGRKFCIDSDDTVHMWDRNTCSKSGKSFDEFAVEWLGV